MIVGSVSVEMVAKSSGYRNRSDRLGFDNRIRKEWVVMNNRSFRGTLRAAVVATAVVASSVALSPSALAWYPNGFTTSGGACGDTSGLGEAVPLESIEPLIGHTGPWGPVRTTYESPTNKTTESVQRRAVAVRSTGETCESSGVRRISYVYSRFEERTQTTLYTKAGGSTRLVTVPNNPSISEWAPA